MFACSSLLICSGHCRRHRIQTVPNSIQRRMNQLWKHLGHIYNSSMNCFYDFLSHRISNRPLPNDTLINSLCCSCSICSIPRIHGNGTFWRRCCIEFMGNFWVCELSLGNRSTTYFTGKNDWEEVGKVDKSLLFNSKLNQRSFVFFPAGSSTKQNTITGLLKSLKSWAV